MKKIWWLTLLIGWGLLIKPAEVQGKNENIYGVSLPRMEFGEEKIVKDTIDGDLVVAGKRVDIETEVAGDVYTAGGTVNVGGVIDGDLVVAGGEVTIKGMILKNLIVAGGQVTVEDGATIGGYTLAAGGTVKLLGQFGGSVQVASGKIETGEATHINGDLIADVTEENNTSVATIDGQKRINIHQTKQENYQQKKIKNGLASGGTVIWFLGKLITLLVLIKLGGKMLMRTGEMLPQVWQNLWLGLVGLIITPVVVVILLTTIIAAPLSLIAGQLYLVSLYLAPLLTAIGLGQWMWKQKWFNNNNYYVMSIIGLSTLSILGLIPMVGGLVKFVVMLLGLGMTIRLIRGERLSKN